MNIAALATIILTSISTGLRAEVCNTPGCLEIASYLNTSMDLTVDPCDDFWLFSCGNYIKSLNNKNYLYHGIFDDESAEAKEKAGTIFEVQSTDADPKWLKKVKNYYSSCMDTARLDKFSVAKMDALLKKLGEWPVLNHDWNDTDFNWADVQKKVHEVGEASDQLVHIYVEIKESSDDENAKIGVDSRNHELNLSNFGNGIDKLQTYLDALVGIAVIFGAEKDRAEQDMHEVVLFEIALANITSMGEDTIAPVPTTISELQKAWPYVSWLDLIRGNLEDNPNITENQNVTVDDPFYIENLGDLLSNTPKRVLANYLMSRVVFSNGLFLNEKIRNLYYAAVYDNPPPRSQTCYDLAQQDMLVAVTACFVRNYFPSKEKNEAVAMLELLRKEFIKVIADSDWVSNSTKARGIAKAGNITLKIGYPDELMNDTFLNDYYKDLKICPWSPWKNKRATLKWNIHHMMQYLHKIIWNEWDYAFTLQSVLFPNAFFQPLGPNLVAYSGIFEGLLYSADRPLNVNLGTLGSTLGHEFTHSVDSGGRYVDEKGREIDWWDEVSEENYKKKEKALADEYSTYKVDDLNMTLNGMDEIKEIIADQGGFKIARNAMDAASREYPSLPGFEQFSAAQMYWISSASQFCSVTDPRVEKYLILKDVHPLDQWRIKGSFRNSPQFALDWGCPVGSFMNPENKFNVW